MSKFSIIIPVYNVAPYLRECLDSVLKQTYASWEAICVDDGSVDGSGEILDEYAVRDSRFRIIHQANAGVGAARNVALDVAIGEWVWFVDADDAIHPGALDLFAGIQGLHPNIETISFTTLREADLERWREPLPDLRQTCITSSITCETIKWHRRAVWGTLICRSSIGARRFSSHRMGEDVLYLSTIFWTTRLHAYLPASVYYYRTRLGSAVNSNVSGEKVRDFLDTELLMLENISMFAKKEDLKEVEKYIRLWRNFDWYGFMGLFVRASIQDMQENLGLWIRLQRLRNRYVNDGLYRRFVVMVARLTGSAMIARQLIFQGLRLNRHIFSLIKMEI